jgi:nicotinate-nucleotide adenylyltransferase
MKRMHTACFGGSFNPIHEGHIAIGEYVLNQGLADEVWYIVSPLNPLKPTADPKDARERLEMVARALENHPRLIACDVELYLPAPSYTADTLKYLTQKYPEREFSLLIGGDNLDQLVHWKDYAYILANYDILVYPRPGATNQVPPHWKRVKLLDAPLMDISSSLIRANQTLSTSSSPSVENELTEAHSKPPSTN